MGLWQWIVDTLRAYPELAIFLALGGGVLDRAKKARRLQPRQRDRHPDRRGRDRADRHHGTRPIKATSSSCSCSPSATASGRSSSAACSRTGRSRSCSRWSCWCSACCRLRVRKDRRATTSATRSASTRVRRRSRPRSAWRPTQINRLGLPAEQAKAYLDAIPIAYAVTYMFGTIGSAIVIAQIGPKLIGIESRRGLRGLREADGGGKKWADPGVFSAYRRVDCVPTGCSRRQGRRLRGAEAESWSRCAPLHPAHSARGEIMDATADIVLKEGDVVAIAGEREVLVESSRAACRRWRTATLLDVPVERRRRPRDEQGRRRQDARASWPTRRRRAACSCARSRAALPSRYPDPAGDRDQSRRLAHPCRPHSRILPPSTAMLGVADRPTDVTDMAFVGAAIVIGALIGALVFKVAGGCRITLSTAGGALLAGLVLGWLRSVRPTFGRIPTPGVWFMNSVGLNIFIAIVGISAGPGFVDGLQQVGVESVPVGRGRDDGPAGSWHVARPVRVPLPRRAILFGIFPACARRRHRSVWSGAGEEPDARRSATP